MPKTAPKSRTKATRKKAATTTRRAAAPKSLSTWQKYCRERDHFYQCHPHVQWLLAIFIILFLVYLALVFAPAAGMSFY